jgi:lysozyme
VGDDRLIVSLRKNWLGAKKNKLRAYHYYRPNENSLEQAELLLKLFLNKGDLPPVLDIEKLPEISL